MANVSLGQQGIFAAARGLIVACAVVASTVIVTRTIDHAVRVKYRERTVDVTGSSQRRITSDRAVWAAVVNARAPTLAEAVRVVSAGTPQVRAFLIEQGVPASEIEVRSIETEEVFATSAEGVTQQQTVVAYRLMQALVVTSGDVARVTRAANAVTRLVERGVDVRSEPPDYIYTRLGELKIQLIAEATRDVRNRADQVARNSGARLGRLVSARIGVVQINAADQSEVTWDGVNDRGSIEKDAMVTVSAQFALE
jgi:hypothetical protein